MLGHCSLKIAGVRRANSISVGLSKGDPEELLKTVEPDEKKKVLMPLPMIGNLGFGAGSA